MIADADITAKKYATYMDSFYLQDKVYLQLLFAE
jgi:hypothetical protein